MDRLRKIEKILLKIPSQQKNYTAAIDDIIGLLNNDEKMYPSFIRTFLSACYSHHLCVDTYIELLKNLNGKIPDLEIYFESIFTKEIQNTLNYYSLISYPLYIINKYFNMLYFSEIYEYTPLEESIINDDVETFQSIIHQRGIFNFTLQTTAMNILTEVHSPILKDEIYSIEHFTERNNFMSFHFISYAAFYGSQKCFIYLFLNTPEYELPDDLQIYAVCSGNPQIIHLLEQKGMNFYHTISYSIKYHRNDVFEWIREKYNIQYHNNSIIENSMHFNNCKLLNRIISYLSSIINQTHYIGSFMKEAIVNDNYYCHQKFQNNYDLSTKVAFSLCIKNGSYILTKSLNLIPDYGKLSRDQLNEIIDSYNIKMVQLAFVSDYIYTCNIHINFSINPSIFIDQITANQCLNEDLNGFYYLVINHKIDDINTPICISYNLIHSVILVYHQFSENGFDSEKKFIIKIFKALLEEYPNIDINSTYQGYYGECGQGWGKIESYNNITPLHMACNMGSLEIVSLLLEHKDIQINVIGEYQLTVVVLFF
ncbi:hypothetical protein TRFO_17887 [Tritrichomonas foetus]|uniref:Uncharacterized protein n=1 Tax=Tritrichomonas foetus TaxID=1144522 RepID=A0A1J4KR81_9EUKA|nr:hypothetical protein TRFO_17887 [Tritrichomonas foetus]|eukprot:OHT12308.1 hypothetical protein TRFO_17887 [Tritrichomonas foetus]